MYHSVRTLFRWGWKRLGLKNPGGGQTWTRTLKLGGSLPETITTQSKNNSTTIYQEKIASEIKYKCSKKFVWKLKTTRNANYLEVRAPTQGAVDSHGDKNNAWSRCLRRRGTEPGLQGRETFSLDTSDSKRLWGGGYPEDRRRKQIKPVYLYCSVTFLSDDMKSVGLWTYSWHCDSKVHHDARFSASAKWVAADHIDWCWRRHVELALCCFGHQEEGDLDRAGQPRQITHLKAKMTWLKY